jgi:hypothetical protein
MKSLGLPLNEEARKEFEENAKKELDKIFGWDKSSS